MNHGDEPLTSPGMILQVCPPPPRTHTTPLKSNIDTLIAMFERRYM